jgi:hypothetical protein
VSRLLLFIIELCAKRNYQYSVHAAAIHRKTRQPFLPSAAEWITVFAFIIVWQKRRLFIVLVIAA